MKRSLVLLASVVGASAKDAFVFLGATGDNALRPSGVWQGLYETFAGGVMTNSDIHVAMHAGSTPDEPALKALVKKALAGVISELPGTPGWKCSAPGGDCGFEAFWAITHTNVWPNFHSDEQAKNMTPSLAGYDTLFMYMSIPPFAFGGWAQAAADNWGADRVHVACEKPFGTSLADANSLASGIVAALTASHLHLVDHWVSFFMNKNLPTFRGLVQPRLLGSGANGALEWSEKDFSKIVVTEYEERGLEGRGGFFDKVGQVRDMVQSHLLQVLALSLIDPSAPSKSAAKLAIFKAAFVEKCIQAQYDGFLLEPKLSYHNASADSTLTMMTFHIDLEGWQTVEFVIQTGKDMGTKPNQYTVELYQRNGPGLLTYEVGAEEVGVAGIKVTEWPLVNASGFEAPLPGFVSGKTFGATPSVDAKGNGYILKYDVANLYFPKPYAMMISSLLSADYSEAFLTYPECERSWEIVTASQVAACLDPPPEAVGVYKTPDTCGNMPPNVCYTGHTVKYAYDVTFACNAKHDAKYVNVSLYQAKCKTNGWRDARKIEHAHDWRLSLPSD